MNFQAGLSAFILAASSTAGLAAASPATVAAPAGVPHRYFGLLQSERGAILTLRLRTGRLLTVDATTAFAQDRVAEPLFAGKATVVEGIFGAGGILHAVVVKRTAPNPANWGADH